jgi:hypothetical protein
VFGLRIDQRRRQMHEIDEGITFTHNLLPSPKSYVHFRVILKPASPYGRCMHLYGRSPDKS